MNKYQIVCIQEGNLYNSVSKAYGDVLNIAQKRGFSPIKLAANEDKHNLYLKIKNNLKYVLNWKKIEKTIESNSAILLQYPLIGNFHIISRFVRKLKRKKCKIIILVHDLHSLRFGHNIADEFDGYLKYADVIIVHNDKMKELFVNNGYKEKNIVCLKIFDYLLKVQENDKLYSKTSKTVVLAGVLDRERSPYIYQLGKVDNVIFNLYGPLYDHSLDECSNINYMGFFSQTDLPHHLNEGFGLIWDGNSLNSCTGAMGDYLKINNPHKTSLYLASGIPVFIWSKAALADFVKSNGVGFVIDEISDIESIFNELDEKKYIELKENVANIQGKIVNGYFTNSALEKALQMVNNQ